MACLPVDELGQHRGVEHHALRIGHADQEPDPDRASLVGVRRGEPGDAGPAAPAFPSTGAGAVRRPWARARPMTKSAFGPGTAERRTDIVPKASSR